MLALVLYIISSYRLSEVSMPIIFDDEYGYWANSSYFMGQDWSGITQNIMYYSYGYSFMLMLVRMLAALMGITEWVLIYRMACVLNLLFISGSFFIATRLCKRYMHSLSPVLGSLVCFVAMLYPANTVYSHTTLSECAIMFMFWVFLYIMMRVIEKPGILNHVMLAIASVYAYVIHQRALSMVITAIIIAVFIRLCRISRMRDITAFSITAYVCYIFQTVIKKNLQSVLYMGNPKQDIWEAVSVIFTKKTLLLLVIVAAMLLWLYLIEKKRIRTVCLITVAGIVLALIFVLNGRLSFGGEQVSDRMATNDFAGQWDKVKGIFSKYGLVRLGTSIVGKWFYLAASTALVICWGIRGLIVNAALMAADAIKGIFNAITGKERKIMQRLCTDYREHIWFLGVFLAWIGAFLICAIYKEGLYKVDDLIHGRYIEYTIGIVIIYSMDRLLSDKHWLVMLPAMLALYIAAGEYCQYVYDTLQRTEYELIHAVSFGRIFWNYESPYGKIRELAGYVIPLSVSFVLIIKISGACISKKSLAILGSIAALIIPFIAWTHISYEIIDNYVCVRNEKQSGAAPDIASWIYNLESGENIYFVNDWISYKQAELIQFMLLDKELKYTSFEEQDFEEDAVYIVSSKMLDDDRITEKCEIVRQKGSYALVINRNKKIMDRWLYYKKALQL